MIWMERIEIVKVELGSFSPPQQGVSYSALGYLLSDPSDSILKCDKK